MHLETHYARSGDVSIAYQVHGEGPIDLVLIPPFVSHVEYCWEYPPYARFLHHLASFSRLILFDKRGTGLSDRVDIATLEERMDDVRAVMDAAGSKQAALLGLSEGGAMSILFAATYPDRVTALITYGSVARGAWAPDYPWGNTAEDLEANIEDTRQTWGKPTTPGPDDDPRFLRWWDTYMRYSASPRDVIAIWRMAQDIDIRHVLPSVHVPTLIIHRTHDQTVPVEGSRVIAAHIPGAKLLELPTADHWWFHEDADNIVHAVQEFITGEQQELEPERVLATILFTDIVDSTKRAVEMGDRRWRDLLESHTALVRRELTRFHGREIKTTGDGFLATFDGPARGIRCARAVSDAMHRLGITIRAGLHTGECELIGADIGGIAVHIGARVSALAGADEVLVSHTVKDLVAGSGLRFQDRGTHMLKGVPGEWRLFAVE
jgi:pimeloyl-ACP methyl ester carboxylesterase